MIDRDGAPAGSPGCFGRALSFRAGTAECEGCPFADRCQPLSEARTRAVRQSMGIAAKEPKSAPAPARKPAAPLPQAALGMSLPIKVVDLLGRIERAGTRVTESLAQRRNPFVSTPAFMRIVCHVLLKKPEGVSRAYLAAALKHQFGWADNTAVPHATQAVQALCALGAVREADGIVTLSV